LAELELHCLEVIEKWPVPAGQPIRDEAKYPEIWKLARFRDRTSDSVQIFAAMAVEGYLNFYGVLRLGQSVFDEHFERLGLIPKLRSLLLVCDGLQIDRNDALVTLLDRLAQRRNSLVHPKTREFQGHPSQHQATAIKIPEVAREAVANMEAFFCEFLCLVPTAGKHLRKAPDA